MNRFSLTLTLLVFGSLTKVFSQVDYRPGYIVSLNGDTLRGLIDYRNWLRNPKTIDLRSSAQHEDRTYKPLEIQAFGVAGDVYESAIIPVDISPTTVGEYSEPPDPQLVTDTAFVRALIIGEKSLYIYHSTHQHGNTDQYYIRNNGKWELLIYKKYTRKQSHEEGARKLVATNKRYISQLAFYLNGCPTIQKKMDNLHYGSASFERLFHAYYECTTTAPVHEKKPEKTPLEFGLLAGGVQTTIDFNIPNAYLRPFSPASFSNDFSFTGGIFLDVIRQRDNRKWSLNNELVYTSFVSEATHYTQTNADYYTNTSAELKFSYLKLNTMVRFKYPIGKWHVFANAGISYALVLSKSDRTTEVGKAYGPITVKEKNVFTNGTESYDLGILGGLGVRYHRYAFETRIEKTRGLIHYIGMNARLTRVAFLLSYRLTK